MLIFLFLICLYSLREFDVEAIKVIVEDAKIVELDPQYFDPEKCQVRIDEDEETGETSGSAVISLIKTFPPGTYIHTTLMKFSMGRYTIPTGLETTMDLCVALTEPIIGGPFVAAMGIKKDECPPPTRIYTLDRYQTPEELLPDDFVESKYVAHFEIGSEGKTLIKYDIYVYVQDDQ